VRVGARCGLAPVGELVVPGTSPVGIAGASLRCWHENGGTGLRKAGPRRRVARGAPGPRAAAVRLAPSSWPRAAADRAPRRRGDGASGAVV